MRSHSKDEAGWTWGREMLSVPVLVAEALYAWGYKPTDRVYVRVDSRVVTIQRRD